MTAIRTHMSHLPLGITYRPERTSFTVHAEADAVRLRLVHPGTRHLRVVDLDHQTAGNVFLTDVKGDLRGWTYSYEIRRREQTITDIVDPWATLVRDHRAIIEAEDSPVTPRPELDPTGAVIYELHVRDWTNDESSGVRSEWRGHYLGITERNTRIGGAPEAPATALDHLLELGVNVVQLMPVHSFAMLHHPIYEWGYMPNDYNAPHAGYAVGVDLEAPIREFKQLVSALHEAGLRVTLDVVYNHNAERWPDRLRSLMALAPESYFRFNDDGTPWDGSACGNEFKSDSPQGRRFLRESCKYWVERFGIDGFRFDLMGLIDADTMALIAQDLHAIDPSLLLYGEPWAAGPTPIEINGRGMQRSRGWGVFNDRFRDALRGEVFDLHDLGFLNGGANTDAVKAGIVGGVRDFTDAPHESINYAEVHDNHTLVDRLHLAAGAHDRKLTPEECHAMSALAAWILLTSQGLPLLHAGQEFGRTKQGADNTYNMGDAVNNLRWSLKAKHMALFSHYKSAVAMRAAHPMFRLRTTRDVEQAVQFLDDDLGLDLPPGVVAYTCTDPTGDDPWHRALLAFNGSRTQCSFAPPEGAWRTAVRDNAPTDHVGPLEAGAPIPLAPHSATILFEPRA